MPPARRKGPGRAAAAAAAQKQWKVGDLVLAKMKGFPPWPAVVAEPKEWGYSSDRKKVLVYFYGTKQIAFCNYADIEGFTEERKKSLLTKRQGKGADFVRALDEIVAIYEKLKRENHEKPPLRDEGTASSAGNSEGSESKGNNKSPEHSSYISQNHQATPYISIENHDAFGNGENPTSLMEGDHDKTVTVKNEPSEMISILDQLRQTPLSATNNSRKRQGDTLQGRAIQRRAPSLRRSRSLSGGCLYKFQNSNTKLNGNNSADDDLIPDAVPEEAIQTENVVREVPDVSASRYGPGSIGLLHNGNYEGISSESASLKSEVINVNDGNILESNCKTDLRNGFSQVENMNGEVSWKDKLDLPTKTVIFKRKRKSNRKRNSTECAKLKQEADSQAEISGNISGSLGCQNEINRRSDGDEHLPLVKRARARMSKHNVEEAQLDETIYMQMENNGPTGRQQEGADAKDKPAECAPSISPQNNCAVNNTTLNVKESLDSVTHNCPLNLGRDVMFWKGNKYNFKSVDLDVEADLPPSKRLHRALEAMSANAAEAIDDNSEVRREPELLSIACLNSPGINSSHPSSEDVAGSHASSLNIHLSSNSPCSSGSIMPSYVAPQNPEASTVALSEKNTDEVHNGSLRSSSNKDYAHILMDVEDCNGSSDSKAAVAYGDCDQKRHEPCFFNLIEKQTNAILNERTCVKLPYKEDMRRQVPSCLEEVNLNHSLPQTKKSHSSRIENFSRDGDVQSSAKKLGSVLNSKKVDNLSPPNGIASLPTNSTGDYSYGLAKASHSDICGLGDMQDIAKEVAQSVTKEVSQDVAKEVAWIVAKEVSQDLPKEVGQGLLKEASQDVPKEHKYYVNLKDRCASPDSTRMKDLIAAAQAKRHLSRSSSFPDNTLDGKALASPSLFHRDESFGHGSPRNPTVYRTSASDDSIACLQNGIRSPHASVHSKGPDKISSYAEANASRNTFEALLCNLSRTKESIGRATRLAIECARCGIAGQVVDTLLKYLEREPNLYRRVDLFFLVDSITQCSRNQKGGDVYPSLVQSALPRLLIAAAPSGNAAGENRKQCLKVLRVWLERKILPESVIRHHMRELEAANEALLSSAYSRRPLRTERALNDPVREMEGMLVDEYGSNTGFRLPNFLHSNVLEDDEGSSDDEKCFEAVTPDSNAEPYDGKRIAQVSTEKRRHVLEDVDGELEMEDLAPSCEVEAISTCPVAALGNVDHNYQVDHHPLPFTPPLPEDKPPSPPPLPSSPPPLPSSPPPMAPYSMPPMLISQHMSGSHAFADAPEFNLSRVANNLQNQPRPICQQRSNIDVSLMMPDAAPYYHHVYGVLTKQLPAPLPSLVSSTYENLPGPLPTSHMENKNPQSLASIPLRNNSYSLHPPPPSISNHYSYVRSEQRQTQASWGNCSSSTDNFQHVHEGQRGNFYVDRDTRASMIDHEISDRGRFTGAAYLGHVHSDKVDKLPARPPSGILSPTVPCHGWSLPPRPPSYYVPASRPLMENQISRGSGARGYWRSR